MRMTISNKLGLILIISTVLILLSSFISWQYNQKIDLTTNKTQNESVLFALKTKEKQINNSFFSKQSFPFSP